MGHSARRDSPQSGVRVATRSVALLRSSDQGPCQGHQVPQLPSLLPRLEQATRTELLWVDAEYHQQ